MSVRENIIYYIKKNIFIVLVLIGLCPVLALSYAKFTINSESYRSNEMYISELLYSIKIDGNNVYSVEIESGETEHTIEITSLSGISTNYKLAYLNNDNLEVRYASDYMDTSFGGIIMTRTISLTIKNKSNEKQTLSLMVFGGYSFNDVNEVKVLDTYTEILDDYWKYDYETTALYVDSERVNKLDLNKYYKLKSYTCNNDTTVEYNNNTKKITVDASKQTKCSLYFEEVKTFNFAQYLIDKYQTLGLTKIDQNATGNQNYATTEYRYQGKSPNNYITFNDEIERWRIIGVFEVETPNEDGTYTKENKVKIIRNQIRKVAFSASKNDWTTASLKTTLNSGNYYNRTGTYASNGLTAEAKNQISSTKWYLGNIVLNGLSFGNTKQVYTQERSTSVPSGNKQTWDGEVGLVYPSDYMYASSGCYNTSTLGSSYNNSTCTSTNWLANSSYYWTISPRSDSAANVMNIVNDGSLTSYLPTSTDNNIRPVLFLSSSVLYMSGDGSTSNPFVIE